MKAAGFVRRGGDMEEKTDRAFPRGSTRWLGEQGTLFVSVPFTWNLPTLRRLLNNADIYVDHIVVGGPAIRLMPRYFEDCPWITTDLGDLPGVMQKVNPYATKTSTGCVRTCEFCAVPKTEGALKELDDWPDLPIITDNNLLACSLPHFDRVMDRLENHQGVDFNQGLDARLLTQYHAERIALLKIAKRGVRLALDNASIQSVDTWSTAYAYLRMSGVARRNISSYALIGFDSDPPEAWARCLLIEKTKSRVLPMWFHELDAMKANQVTEKQKALGWDDYERRRIMQWFYQHKKAKR